MSEATGLENFDKQDETRDISRMRPWSSSMMAKTRLWLQLWLSIKPNLRCSQFGKFEKEYEDKVAEAEANIDGAVAARAKVQTVYDGFAAQKNELQLADPHPQGRDCPSG